jgi:hypothetical protein
MKYQKQMTSENSSRQVRNFCSDNFSSEGICPISKYKKPMSYKFSVDQFVTFIVKH